jgi:hypothetical protein
MQAAGIAGGAGPMAALQAVGAFDKMFGPKGSVTQGDISGIAQGIGTLMGGMGVGQAAGAMPGRGEPTTMSTFGLTPEQFGTIPPEVKQELLRKMLGR